MQQFAVISVITSTRMQLQFIFKSCGLASSVAVDSDGTPGLCANAQRLHPSWESENSSSSKSTHITASNFQFSPESNYQQWKNRTNDSSLNVLTGKEVPEGQLYGDEYAASTWDSLQRDNFEVLWLSLWCVGNSSEAICQRRQTSREAFLRAVTNCRWTTTANRDGPFEVSLPSYLSTVCVLWVNICCTFRI